MKTTLSRRSLIGTATGAALTGNMLAQVRAAAAEGDREYWIRMLDRIAKPLLSSLSQRRLKIEMLVEAVPGVTDRRNYTYLEALGRLLSGIGPWLESGESDLCRRYAEQARMSIAAA